MRISKSLFNYFWYNFKAKYIGPAAKHNKKEYCSIQKSFPRLWLAEGRFLFYGNELNEYKTLLKESSIFVSGTNPNAIKENKIWECFCSGYAKSGKSLSLIFILNKFN